MTAVLPTSWHVCGTLVGIRNGGFFVPGPGPAHRRGALGVSSKMMGKVENKGEGYGPEDPQYSEHLTGGGKTRHSAVLTLRLSIGHVSENHS
jgi:hypothetical protein